MFCSLPHPSLSTSFSHLGVHLVPPPDGGVVVRREQAFVRPGEAGGVEAVVGFVFSQGGSERGSQADSGAADQDGATPAGVGGRGGGGGGGGQGLWGGEAA